MSELTPTTILDGGNQTALAVPRIKFVTGWLHGLTPAQVARDLTGRDLVTGELTLGVGIRNRHNGAVRLECDPWKLPFDFHADTLSLLAGRWQRENEAMPKRALRTMEQHFGRTHFVFDVMKGYTRDWRKFLATMLGNAGSYAEIAGNPKRN
jgi:hypothetical protein